MLVWPLRMSLQAWHVPEDVDIMRRCGSVTRQLPLHSRDLDNLIKRGILHLLTFLLIDILFFSCHSQSVLVFLIYTVDSSQTEFKSSEINSSVQIYKTENILPL
jgi:hypothetical protein